MTRSDLVQVLTELRALGPADIADHLILHWPHLIDAAPAVSLGPCYCGDPAVIAVTIEQPRQTIRVPFCRDHAGTVGWKTEVGAC